MSEQTGPLSPDGRWRWDGLQWLPAQAPVGAGVGAYGQPGPAAGGAFGGPYGAPGGPHAGPNPHDSRARRFGIITFLAPVMSIPAFFVGRRGRDYARRTGVGGGGSTFGFVMGIIGFVVLGLMAAFIVFAVAVSDDDVEDSLAGPMTSFELAIVVRDTDAYGSVLPGRAADVTVRCPDDVGYDTVGVFVCDASMPAFGGAPGELAVIPLDIEIVDGRIAVLGASVSDGSGCGEPLCITGGSSGD